MQKMCSTVSNNNRVTVTKPWKRTLRNNACHNGPRSTRYYGDPLNRVLEHNRIHGATLAQTFST